MEPTDIDAVVNTEDTEVDESAGGLPSAKESGLDTSGWEINEERASKYVKNGKFFGRFDNIDGMAEALKSVEDKYANMVRESKNATKDTENQATKEANLYEVAQPLVQKFMDGGMELTPEIEQMAIDKGLDIRDVKLAAIELKERVVSAHNLVGGKEEYESMIEWGKTTLPEKQRNEFDKGIKSGMSEWAIKGLYAEYKANQSGESTSTPERVRGDSATSSTLRGYDSREEMLRDRNYINSPRGRTDKAAQTAHKIRLDKTHDTVIYGR